MSHKEEKPQLESSNSTPAYVTGGVIYCPLPEALTSTGELTVLSASYEKDDNVLTIV